MSKVQPRGEISPFTAAVVTLSILAVSGLSVWHFVLRDTASSFAAPSTQIAPVQAPVAAGAGLHPQPAIGIPARPQSNTENQ